MISRLFAITLLVLSAPLLAASDLAMLSNGPSQTAFVDRHSVAAAGPIRSVRVLRSYDELIRLGVNPVTRQDIHPHRSVKLQFVANCASGRIALYSWEMFTGALGDGESVWSESHSGAPDFSPPRGTEERSTFAMACESIAVETLARSAQ